MECGELLHPETGRPGRLPAKVTVLADAIAAAAPNLVALQEIGDPASFDALRAQLGGGWTGELATQPVRPSRRTPATTA